MAISVVKTTKQTLEINHLEGYACSSRVRWHYLKHGDPEELHDFWLLLNKRSIENLQTYCEVHNLRDLMRFTYLPVHTGVEPDLALARIFNVKIEEFGDLKSVTTKEFNSILKIDNYCISNTDDTTVANLVEIAEDGIKGNFVFNPNDFAQPRTLMEMPALDSYRLINKKSLLGRMISVYVDRKTIYPQ